MSRKPQIALKPRERVLTAFAERASGPGWSNRPLWIVIVSPTDGIRVECIQPDDHTPAMIALYDVSEAAHSAMMRAVEAVIRRTSDEART